MGDYPIQVDALSPSADDHKLVSFLDKHRPINHEVEFIDGWFRAYCNHTPRCESKHK